MTNDHFSCGISIFPGVQLSFAKNYTYMTKAYLKGIKIIFMSMHIPEMNDFAKIEFMALLSKAHRLKMKVIVDTSKNYFLKYEMLKFNVYGLRLDFGFSDDEIIDIVNNFKGYVFLNASVITPKEFARLVALGLNTNKIKMCHNYYLKEGSGLSYSYFQDQNLYYQSQNLDVYAFIKSDYIPRKPLMLGLPTIEDHRSISFINQINEMQMLNVNHIIVGDAMCSDNELDILSSTRQNVLIVCCKIKSWVNSNIKLLNFLFDQPMAIRNDLGSCLIRFKKFKFQENFGGRGYRKINKNALTIDNIKNLRYKGEVQIWSKKQFLADKVCTVIGEADLTLWMQDNIMLMQNKFIKLIKK